MKKISLIAAALSAAACVSAEASPLTIQSVTTPTPYYYSASNGPADNIKDGNLDTAWNGGTYSDWVQADFGNVYVFDRIELYGTYSVGALRVNNYMLSASSDGVNWSLIASGSYHSEPLLSQGSLKYGAVHNWTSNNPQGRYLRYAQSSGTEWAYLSELVADGHLPIIAEPDPVAPSAVPLPAALPLMASGLGMLGFVARRRKSAA